ncbi:MAG: two-component system sensor histidine kinase ZraS [Desulfovibrionaceae bacterium]|nr:two-component system sensor histidine kinase ZraS [Desulfovibrionaceae bacterium]
MRIFKAEKLGHIPMGIVLFFAFVTLTLMVSLPALISVERNETTLTRLLADKGFALITAFENVLRTGMRSQAGVRLQLVLEQMTQSRDINFIAVTMPDGTIIAHSNRERVGEILQIDGQEASEATMHQLSPRGEKRWSVMNVEGFRSFVVYSNFEPGPPPGRRRPPPPSNRPGVPVPMIFLGMDVSPFEITRSQNRAYVTMLAGVTLLVGLACLLVLYYTQKARRARLGEKQAKSRVAALEEEMRRKEKLAAVGNLAAGVAHEIRNPLSSIKGYATYFAQRFPEGSDDREAASVMVREADRLNRVITDLIGLSKPTDVALRSTRLEEVVQHVARLLAQDAAHRNVRIVQQFARRSQPALADPDRLNQAVLNLCLNALDAMPDGGTLTLAVEMDKDRVRLEVRDTGVGIPPENLSHVFDPYFTTKAKGTGIGLATVHKIVEALNGDIAVTSSQAAGTQPGGTCFTLWLPMAGA